MQSIVWGAVTGPTPEEAAAMIAAIEQFLRDTTPAAPAADDRPSGWVRQARLEAVDREPERF
jgi:hypothetical protein